MAKHGWRGKEAILDKPEYYGDDSSLAPQWAHSAIMIYSHSPLTLPQGDGRPPRHEWSCRLL